MNLGYSVLLQRISLGQACRGALLLPENPATPSGRPADLSVLGRGERTAGALVKGKKAEKRIWVIPSLLKDFGDAALNLCSVGNYLPRSQKRDPADIVNNLTSVEGMRPVWIRQGYARCSCCVVDEKSLITADRGIASACEAAGLQVLLISPGFVALPGFAYGFVGGASFFVSEKSIAFTGSLQGHPYGDRILRFLDARGVTAQPLSAGPLVDIGGAFVFEPNIT